MADEKAVKAAVKEGGKKGALRPSPCALHRVRRAGTVATQRPARHRSRTAPRAGVDLAGMSDMGGVKHFNVAVDTPKGDVELLKKVMEGANTEVDEAAEERKGGASKIGKCFYSAGDEWVRRRYLAWGCVRGGAALACAIPPPTSALER